MKKNSTSTLRGLIAITPIRLSLAFLALACLSLAVAGCSSNSSQSNTTTGGPAIATTGNPSTDSTGPAIATGNPEWRTAVKSKPLSEHTQKGLQWLVAHQAGNGGWGQGDESPQMRSSNRVNNTGQSNVADTGMALLALMRSGSTPSQGQFKDNIARGLNYVLSEIEESDADGLYVSNVRGTRVQSKIGTYVDTFTALIVLTEAKGKMASAEENQRLDRALAKVLHKVEKNQRQDGTWDNRGWAPVLTQSMAAKGLNRAAQSGADVDDATLERVEKQAQAQFDASAGTVAGGGSAGIELYSRAANNSTMRDSMNTRSTKVAALKKDAKSGDTKKRQQAEVALQQTKQVAIATESNEKALLNRLKDPSFISGFGNNGGEEFLSYMLMSESLVVDGGEDWTNWDAQITKLINGVQNADGSWTGHHCITGRTFCTATALLVLMADRAPVPMAAKLKGA